MEEFRAKRKEFTVELGVTMEKPDGTEERKVLSFDCTPENYTWMTSVLELGESLKELDFNVELVKGYKHLKELLENGFNIVAPGQFNTYFEFMNEDVNDCMVLLQKMIETVVTKSVELKKKIILTAIPENATEV